MGVVGLCMISCGYNAVDPDVVGRDLVSSIDVCVI